MSDLQCPASFVLLTPEAAQACDLSELRLSLIVNACAPDAIVQRLAAKDRCTIEASALANGAELALKIEQLADQYRGEQVAVIAAPELLRAALKQRVTPTFPVYVAVDSDGWNIRVE